MTFSLRRDQLNAVPVEDVCLRRYDVIPLIIIAERSFRHGRHAHPHNILRRIRRSGDRRMAPSGELCRISRALDFIDHAYPETHHVIHADRHDGYYGHRHIPFDFNLSGVLKIGLSLLLASHLGMGSRSRDVDRSAADQQLVCAYVTLRIFNLSLVFLSQKDRDPAFSAYPVHRNGQHGLRYTTDTMPALVGIIISFLVSSGVGLSMVSVFVMAPDERTALLRNLGFKIN